MFLNIPNPLKKDFCFYNCYVKSFEPKDKSMEIVTKECFICSLASSAFEIDHNNGFDVSCSSCGRYAMTHSVVDNLTNARRKEIKALLRKAKDKQGYYYISQNVKKELEPVWVDKT